MNLGLWGYGQTKRKKLVFRFWGIVIVEFVLPRLIQSLEALERLWADSQNQPMIQELKRV